MGSAGPPTRLSYFAVSKNWIVVETHGNLFEIDRNRFVPVCGNRPDIFGLVPSGLGADVGPKSTIFGRILKQIGVLLSSAEPTLIWPDLPVGGLPPPQPPSTQMRCGGQQSPNREVWGREPPIQSNSRGLGGDSYVTQ